MPTGERLPVAPRERKPALAALAVLLILVGALGATVLVMRAGNRVSAIEITKPVAVGDVIPADAVTEVMVADGSDVKYVTWDQRTLLTKYHATTALVAGTVLVAPMLTTDDTRLAAGTVVVGLSLKKGQFPAGLAKGDTVAAYLVGNDVQKSGTGSGGSRVSNTLLARKAKILSVPEGSDGGIGSSSDSGYSIVVGQPDAAALTAAAAAGNIALVLVPADKD